MYVCGHVEFGGGGKLNIVKINCNHFEAILRKKIFLVILSWDVDWGGGVTQHKIQKKKKMVKIARK